jgi:hypothetical protein
MKEIAADPKLVAHCGLYCGACGSYLRDRCPGCAGNVKATWCKVRSCCIQNKFSTCADCKEKPDPKECAKFNNFISKVFGFIFNSDRRACIHRIREAVTEAFAKEMSEQKRQSLPRKKQSQNANRKS